MAERVQGSTRWLRRWLLRGGWGAAGLVIGLLLVAFALTLYVRMAQVGHVQRTLADQLNLPEEAFELEDLSAAGGLRVALRDVALIDENGDTIASAPRMTFSLRPLPMDDSEPVELDDVVLQRPRLRLVQSPSGEWNLMRAMRIRARGQDVELGADAAGRVVVLRDIRIENGQVMLALPTEAVDSASFAARLQLPYTQLGGRPYQLYRFRDVNARLPMVRLGGEQGWRAEVASLNARLLEPDLRIRQLKISLASVGEDVVRFQLDALQVGESAFTGGGRIRFADAGPVFDLQVRAAPLAFVDLRAVLPSLPEEGQARFVLDVETLENARTALTLEELAVTAPGVEASGRLTALIGGGEAPVFRDTRINLARLELQVLERWGLVDELPLMGIVEGVVATQESFTSGLQGGLLLNLTARLTPRDEPNAEPSVVTLVGGLALGGPEAPWRLESMRLQLQPLYLSTLASLFPEQRERLRGMLEGVITVSGSPEELRLAGGSLVYRVGDAPSTRLVDLAGSVRLRPELTYELQAEARPLALATLTELFPGLPFRTATLLGPLRVSGTAERVEFAADLSGAAGAIDIQGDVALGEPLRFDVSGQVRTFTPAMILRAELPVEGAITGRFAFRGTPEDLFFDVDLAQTAGSFALRGQVRRPGGGAPQFDVSGQIRNFRIGALLGRPGLFAAPLTGAVDLSGGGAQPYRFDVDLRGDGLVLDVDGFYRSGAVPRYELSGQVSGLNLAQLPLPLPFRLPRTNLNARVQLSGQGTTPETLAGSLILDARGSTISGVPVNAATIRAEAREGVLRVDQLEVALRGGRLSASGEMGLTRPAAGRLEYSLDAPRLGVLAGLFFSGGLQPEVAGSLRIAGWLDGTLRNPSVAARIRGRGLRYNNWRSGTLAVDLQATRLGTGWSGEAQLVGENVVLASGDSFQNVRLDLQGTEQRLAVSLNARRDADTDLAMSGLVDLVDRQPRGILLESLALRAEGTEWELADPARIVWGGVEGVLFRDLLLQRVGEGSGMVRLDGTLPPSGEADLMVQVRELDLDILRQLTSRAPALQGVLGLDLQLQGSVADPTLQLNAWVSSLRYRGTQADSVSLNATYADGRMLARADLWGEGKRLLQSEARIPMSLAFADLLPQFELLREDPLFVRANMDSLDLALLTATSPQLEDGSGTIEAQVLVDGTLERPLLGGWARIQNGALRILPLGQRYHSINGQLMLDEQQIFVDSLVVHSEGTLHLSGTVQFVDPRGPVLDLRADLDAFQVMHVEETASVEMSGQLALAGRLPRPVMTGRVRLQESTIWIPDLEEQPGVELTNLDIGQVGADTVRARGIGPGFLSEARIEQLAVEVGESVWLVSDDARLQIGGELIVFRSAEDVRVFGELQAQRGNYTLQIGPLVRQFEITRGRVQFFGTEDLNPELDIVAANRIRMLQSGSVTPITVLVHITGTLQFPRIQLTSDTRPPLPESEILSLLLFGRPSFELGGATGSLAEQVLVQEALGGILFAPLEQIFLRSGLVDFVQFRSAANQFGQLQEGLGMTTVELGTELSDNVFWSVECGIGALFGTSAPSCGTQLQWEIGNQFTAGFAYEPIRRDRLMQLLSPNTVEYQWSVELRRRWEFGRSEAPSVLTTPAGELLPARMDLLRVPR